MEEPRQRYQPARRPLGKELKLNQIKSKVTENLNKIPDEKIAESLILGLVMARWIEDELQSLRD